MSAAELHSSLSALDNNPFFANFDYSQAPIPGLHPEQTQMPLTTIPSDFGIDPQLLENQPMPLPSDFEVPPQQLQTPCTPLTSDSGVPPHPTQTPLQLTPFDFGVHPQSTQMPFTPTPFDFGPYPQQTQMPLQPLPSDFGLHPQQVQTPLTPLPSPPGSASKTSPAQVQTPSKKPRRAPAKAKTPKEPKPKVYKRRFNDVNRADKYRINGEYSTPQKRLAAVEAGLVQAESVRLPTSHTPSAPGTMTAAMSAALAAAPPAPSSLPEGAQPVVAPPTADELLEREMLAMGYERATEFNSFPH